MAKYSNTVEYNLKTTLDKSGIADLQAEIRKTQNRLKEMSNQQIINPDVANKAKRELQELQNIINKSFNAKLGMLDISKFSKEMQKANKGLGEFQQAFATAGVAGDIAFNNTLKRLGTLDTGIKSISKTTDKMFNTIGNTVRWGVVASGFQSILNSAHDAAQYMKDLDSSLTNIMMVTNYSRDAMNDYAKSANEAAKALGSTTVAMTDATLVFAQQGFSLPQSSQLAELSTKLANVSQQQTSETSDQITAMMNAFNLTDLTEIQAALDSWANVANVSAADVQELATASKKAASAASTVGVSFDQMSAQIAAIESVTREAPENIGNGLKTIYARMSDISLGETLEDGVNLGKVTSTLEKVGVEALNQDGTLKGVGDIMEDLMDVWSSLDTTQKAAVGATLAGKYQLTRFEALMNRSDLYDQYLSASENADGTMDVMNEKYVDSLEGKLNKLQASTEGLIINLFDTDSFYPFIDALSTTVELMDTLVESIGGGGNALLGFGAIATKVFSNNIAGSITNILGNRSVRNKEKNNSEQIYKALLNSGLNDVGGASDNIKSFIGEGLQYSSMMSEQQQERYNTELEKTVALENKSLELKQKMKDVAIATNQAYRQAGETEDVIKIDENGNFDTTEFQEAIAAGGQDYILNKQQIAQLDFTEVANSANIASLKISNIEKELKQVSSAGLTLNSTNDELKGLYDAADVAEQALTDLRRELGFNSDAAQKVEIAYDKFLTTLVESNDLEQAKQDFKELAIVIRDVQSAVGRENARQNVVSPAGAYNLADEIAENDERINAQADTNKAFTDTLSTQANIQQIMQGVAALGELAFAIQSVQNLGSIWKNENISTGEKIFQTITNLAMIIPSAVFGLMDLSVGMNATTVALQRYITTQGLYNAATATQLTMLQLVSAAIKTKIISLVGLNAAELTSATLTQVLSAAFVKLTTSINLATIATKLFQIATGPVGWAILAISTLIGLVYTATEAFKAWTASTPEGKLDAAANSAEQAAESFNRLNSSIGETKSSLETLKSEEKTLNVLTKGSAEWYEKLREVNDIVLSLLDKMPELQQYLTSEDGVLSLSEEGYDYAANKLNQQLQTSANIKTATNIQKVKAEQNILLDDFEARGLSADTNLGIGNNKELLTFLSGYYDKYGEILFNANSSSAEDIIQTFYAGKGWSEKTLTEATENLKTILAENKDIIKEYAGLEGQVQLSNDLLMQNRLDSIGSVRSVSDTEQLLGKNYSQRYDEARNTAKSKFGNWNDRIDYAEGDSEWEDIQKVVALQGEGAEYKEQRDGKMIISVGDEEIELTSDQFYDQLAESYAGEQFESEFKTKLIGSLNNALGQVATDGSLAETALVAEKTSLTDLVAMDNLYQGLQTALEGQSDFSADDIMQQLYSASGNDASNFSDMMSNYSHIDFTNVEVLRELRNEAIKLGEGSSNIDTFTQAMNRLNEAGKLESMSGDFSAAAAEYGLGDKDAELAESAESMQNYAKQLMSLSEEAEDAASNVDSIPLAESAEAAKDTAIEVARMNKGVETLAENFDEWGDILRNSSKDSMEYVDALVDTRSALSDVLDIEEDLISDNFIEKHLNEIERASQGDAEAIDALRAAMNEEMMLQFSTKSLDVGLDRLNELNTEVQNLAINLPDVEVGATVQDADFLAGANRIREAAAMTADEANAYFANIGYEPVYAVEDVPAESVTPLTGTKIVVDDVGFSSIWSEDGSLQLPMPRLSYHTESYQVGTTTSTSTVGLVGMSGDGTAPEIKGLRKKAGGSYNNNSSRNSGGGKSSGGGGGGGGSSKKKDPIDDKVDRYHDVNRALEKNASELDAIADAEDRLAHTDWLVAQEQQVALLEEEIALHNEKLRLQREEAAELKTSLGNDFGVQFDSEGMITNYNEIEQGLIDEVNRANDSEDEAWQERAAKRLEQFREDAGTYEDLITSGIADTTAAAEAAEDKWEDIQIGIIQRTMEAAESLEELKENWVEFQRVMNSKSKDDPIADLNASLETLGNYLNNDTQLYNQMMANWQEQYDKADERGKAAIQKMMDAATAKYQAGQFNYIGQAELETQFYNEQIDQYQKTGRSDVYGENGEQLYVDAAEALARAQERAKAAQEAYWQVQEDIKANFEAMNDALDEQLELHDAIYDSLDHQYDMVEMMHGDKAYDELLAIKQEQAAVLEQEKVLVSATIESLKQARDQFEYGSEEWLAGDKQVIEAEKELKDINAELMQNARDAQELAVNQQLDAWANSVIGGDFEWMEQQWELINRNADQYLDSVNKAYNIQKLQSKYTEMLDGSNDLYIQERITEQMNQQLSYLREKEELSEYDVAYAEAQLEILQKQIALEDAQRNKNQMRLRRDSQGNYSYRYTADEGDIASAENDLLDAQNNAYNLSKDAMIEAQSNTFSTISEAKSILADIWTNANLDLTEKTERAQFIFDNLKDYMGGIAEQLSTSETNIIQDFIGMVELLSDENSYQLSNIYDEIISGNDDAFSKIEERWGQSLLSWEGWVSSFNASTEGLQTNLATVWSKIQTQAETAFTPTEEAISKAGTSMEQLKSYSQNFFDILEEHVGALTGLQTQLDAAKAALDRMKDTEEGLYAIIKTLEDKLETYEGQSGTYTGSETPEPTSGGGNGGGNGGNAGGGNGGNTNGGDGKIRVGDVVTYTGKYYHDSGGANPAGTILSGVKNGVVVDSKSPPKYGGSNPSSWFGSYDVHIKAADGSYTDLGWVKPSQISGYRSGGYTGDWNGSGLDGVGGKAAILHQKELVLNASDTENILAAVKAVRSMVDIIKSGALQNLNSLTNISNIQTANESQGTQNFYVTAEFPNAESVNEIREALLSLNEYAVQYAYRR